MNFVVSSNTFLKNLQAISGVLNTNNKSLPILDNFLFEIKDGLLTVSASDTETLIRVNVELIKSDQDGSICVPAKMLLDILKMLPDQPCTFSVDLDKKEIELVYDSGRSKMVGESADEYPKPPKVEGEKNVRVSGELLLKGINKTIFATGNDDLRPLMSGVFFEISSEEINFVATDAHKLVRYTRTDINAEDDTSFTLPKKPLNLLKATVSPEEEVEIKYSDVNAEFNFGDYVLICRLIDGTYPNYRAVIPKENPNVLTIDRVQLLNSIKRVSIFSNKATHLIGFKITGSELVLSAEDVEFSNSAVERLTCSYNGVDIEMGFNAKFLLDLLNNLDSENIEFRLSEPARPGLLIPCEKEEHEDILMLIMPVLLS